MPHRLFIAVQISPEVRAELARLQEKLKRENPRLKITWVKPEVMHLTLHFLGDVEEGKIKEIKTGLLLRPGRIAMTSTPRLTLESLDAFPNPREPRVIVVKAQDEGGRLAVVQKQLGQDLSRLGLSIDSRLFRTHLTLGRVKSQSGRLRGLELPVAPLSWEIKSVELMESQLTSAGPIYSQLFSQHLNF